MVQDILTSEECKALMWNMLVDELHNEYGAAGVIGNIICESNCKSDNVQNSYEKRVGNDSTYTNNVNTGVYSVDQFSRDSAGYGLAQWTYHTRKRALYNFMKTNGFGIADTLGQIKFLISELKGYKLVWNTLVNAKSIREASNAVLIHYEKPASKDSINTQNYRAQKCQSVYDQFHTDKDNKEEVKELIKQISTLLDRLNTLI